MDINSLFNLQGKAAVVTGGSRGIGEMITAAFLANGVKTYITARKAPALIDKANELSDKYGGECIAVPCDLSTNEGIYEFVSEIQSKETSLDILINNAGGGIFRILPGEKDTPKYNTYFETVHQRNAKYVANAFDFRYYKLQIWRSLEGQLKNFLNTSSGPAILEVKTPRTQNDILLKKYFSQMAIEPKNNG